MTKGVESSALDLLAVAIYLGQGRSRHPLPFRFSLTLYFLAVLLSSLQAEAPVATMFYAWQLVRIFFVYMVVARACEDERVAGWLMMGMGAGLYIEACFVVWQRFALHFLQTPGTFIHQNALGLVANLVALPYFALLLAGKRGWSPVAVPLVSSVIVVLTASRAALGLGVPGFMFAIALSLVRGVTARKALVALIGVIAIAATVPLGISSLENRFKYNPLQSDYDERAALMHAGEMMFSDNPNGVGANNFALVANLRGYEDAAGVAPRVESRSALIHNIYWLAAVETGYIGLAALLLFLLRPLIVAFRCGWRNRGDRRGDFLLGFATTLVIFYIHCYFEWIFFSDQVQYLFAMTVGIIAGVAQQLGYWRPKVRIRTDQRSLYRFVRPQREIWNVPESQAPSNL
jgi:O-antigen ligase